MKKIIGALLFIVFILISLIVFRESINNDESSTYSMNSKQDISNSVISKTIARPPEENKKDSVDKNNLPIKPRNNTGKTTNPLDKELGKSTGKRVHWNIPITYDLCGDTTRLPDNGEYSDIHGHGDQKIHVEKVVDPNNRKETLGQFFETAKIKFSPTRIDTYKNGDSCEGNSTPGKVILEVNGVENTEFGEYILNKTDEIKVIFR